MAEEKEQGVEKKQEGQGEGKVSRRDFIKSPGGLK